MSDKKITIQASDGSLNMIDWVIFAVLALFCFFTMQQGDILITGGASFSLLNGHVIDFYTYAEECIGGMNYMISTYILFAIWNLPIRLLGVVTVPTMAVPYGVLMWYKALPALLYVLSGYLIFTICKELEFDKSKSKIAAYAFMTMPIAFFSQFMFGQYDVFTVFFMLLGVRFYFKPHQYSLYYCSLFFGLACTFKYFSLLIYIPLLLLREKRIWKLAQNGVCFIAPILLAVCPFLSSNEFQTGVAGFGATSYIFNAGMSNGAVKAAVIPVAWIVICIYALLKEELSFPNETFVWAVFLCNIVLFLCFGVSHWHPQWLLLATPFWSLSLITHKRIDVSCLLDMALMLFFSIFVVNFWPNHVDQHLFALGAFGSRVVGRLDTALAMRKLYGISNQDLVWTSFVGILAAKTVSSHPKYSSDDLTCSIKDSFGWLRARFLVGVSIFLIPALICLVSMWLS